MHAATPARTLWPSSLTPLLLGCVAGAAWQVTQSRLWPLWMYLLLAGMGLAGLALRAWAGRRGRGVHRLWAAVCAALLVGGLTGWRAQDFAGQALSSELEGRDLRIVGVVASLPQNLAQGMRWRMEVEQARIAGSEEVLAPFPALIELSWYAPRGRQSRGVAMLPDLRPGQRWALTVRLKRPHGTRNPHGFDYELWQWEQGVQATGHVREQPAARQLADTGSHALQRWRQQMRDAILGRTSALAASLQRIGLDPAHAPRMLGVVAALAMGDQQAIARWSSTIKLYAGFPHKSKVTWQVLTNGPTLATWVVTNCWSIKSYSGSARHQLWALPIASPLAPT